MTCKILALVDSLGNLIKFRLMPGQYHDLVETKPLIEDVDFQALLADKAFDADWLIQELNERKVKVVIPPKSNRKVMRAFDTIMYKWRHLIENYFCSVHDKFHRTLILSGFCLLKIAKISLNSSFFPKPIKR